MRSFRLAAYVPDGVCSQRAGGYCHLQERPIRPLLWVEVWTVFQHQTLDFHHSEDSSDDQLSSKRPKGTVPHLHVVCWVYLPGGVALVPVDTVDVAWSYDEPQYPADLESHFFGAVMNCKK